MSKKKYDESQIRVLEGLEAVRLRPGMYVGSTSSKGLHHLVWEIVDNSVDEYGAGHGDEIRVTIHKDNSITVRDQGRGIPVGMHETGKPTVEVVLTVLHAGGKFGGENSGYKKSGGLHGVGSSCVNALSTHFIATVKRDGKVHQIEFSEGKTTVPVHVIGTCPAEETGTTIWFSPDPSIFQETVEYDYETIFTRLRELAFLNPGLKMVLTDERETAEAEDGTETFKSDSFYYEEGLQDFVRYINKGKKTLHDKIFYFKDEKDDVFVEVALQYQGEDGYTKDGLFSFANNIKTHEGGTHETGFKSALAKAIVDYIKQNDLMKGDMPISDDVRVGMISILSVRVTEPQFEGQTKAKLVTNNVRGVVDELVFHYFTRFMAENPEIAAAVVEKVKDSFRVRLAEKKAREQERDKNKKMNSRFGVNHGKLAPCVSTDPEEIELYIVEGDSAGGSAKQGRDKQFQSILPLRGKVINIEKAKIAQVLKNKEIESIGFAIGTDVGDDFDYSKRLVSKIVIMTDADVDGAHIQTLLLTFFYRMMRPLIERGHIYIANPPLYKVEQKRGKKEELHYAYSDQELQQILRDLPSSPKPNIQRYKGLGEMNALQLWETTLDPETRTLFRVSLDDAVEAEKIFSDLMGDDVAPRKEFIELHAHEAVLDV